MKIGRVLVARVRGSTTESAQCAIEYCQETLRSCIFLGVPFGSALKAFASFAKVVKLLQIDLANLLLAIRCLPEASGLR